MDPDRAAPDSTTQQPPSLVGSLLLLIGILAIFWPAFAAYGYWRDALGGVLASAACAVVCGIAASVSLLITVAAQRARQPITGVLVGMLVRMAVPLLALVALPQAGVWEASGGQGMLLGYYFVALAVETWLLVRLVPAYAAGVAKAT